MRPVVVTQTGTGTSPVIITDYIQTPFNASISTVVTGTVTYTIQHTFDDVYAANYNPATGNWYNHDNTDMVNATSNQNDNFAYPIRGCRINQTAGSGSTQLTYIQGLGE
jgi:hypothetical protein